MKQSKKGMIREGNTKKILAAAELEFVKHGYKGTSIQSISDAAELPKANLLYYFTNKETLYGALLKDILLRWEAYFSGISENDDPAQSLELYITTKVEQAVSHPNASKILATELIQGAPNLKGYLRSELRDWLDDKCKIIESWIAQGKMNKVDPEKLFFLIWSSTQHYADFKVQVLSVYDKAEYEAEDVESITRFLCHMILSGCGLTPSQKL